MELANKYQVKEIESLLSSYAHVLIQQGKKMEAIELYRKANQAQNSAQMLFDIAKEESKRNCNPMILKKYHVLAALEMERFHQLKNNVI